MNLYLHKYLHFANFTGSSLFDIVELVFGEKYGVWIILVAIAIATGISYLMYYKSKDTSELTSIQKKILIALRFISVFLIVALLGAPLLKTIRKIVQNPVVILAVDNSASIMGNSDQEETTSGMQSLISELRGNLSEDNEFIDYSFGETLKKLESVPDFSEKRSAYSKAIQDIYNQHFNENIGALILVGDGIYNQGENPINTAQKLNFPVYTVGLGDTTAYQDTKITDLRINRSAFLGNLFPVEADISYQGITTPYLDFKILHNGETVYSETIQTTQESGFRTIKTSLTADLKGLQYYTAVVESSHDERNKENNSHRFVIQILENKQNILIISNGVHPDAGAIKNALQMQVNYEVAHFTSEPYPADLKQFNLVILEQIPSSSQSGSDIINYCKEQRIPILFLVGAQTHLPQFNLVVNGVDIQVQAGNFEDAQSYISEGFTLFTLSNDLSDIFDRFPPIKVPFARFELSPEWTVIANQKIRNIATDRPVMAVSNLEGHKMGVVFGEGIWKWRLYNYLSNENHDSFNELISKLIQYLALRDNEDNFIVNFQPVYQETEPVLITAEVYNEAFEPITLPEVRILLKDSTQQEFSYIFDRGNQFYRLDLGLLPPGRYTFEASTEIGNKTYLENGEFAVMPVNFELLENQANHRVLYQISHQTGGSFFLPDEIPSLVREIESNTNIKPFHYFQTMMNEILNLKWIFFVILLLMSVEWFLRKFWGIY